MKRFYTSAEAQAVEGGWQVHLDGRPIRTQGGAQQVVPSEALARMLAAEWAGQGKDIDPKAFIHRDMADFAIDAVAPDPAETIAKLLRYAETDTLCYRAAPEEPLFARQEAEWEPILTACEARHGVQLPRTSGIMHQPLPDPARVGLRARLETLNPFTLAALLTMTSLTASLATGLAMLEEDADDTALFAAANLEEDWQAELWGWDHAAQEVRAARLEAFQRAADFLAALRR